MKDFNEKLGRIRTLLDDSGYEALVLGRRDNFAWLTGGKEGGVIRNMEGSFVYLVFTPGERIAVAMNADIRKAEEELLCDMGFRFQAVDWKSSSKEEYIERLLDGKRFLTDILLKGGCFDLDTIYDLEYPMTEREIKRYRKLGALTDDILSRTAEAFREGMTENDLKKEMLKICAQEDVEVDVMQVGTDERVKNYRHCTPTDKVIGKTILLSPVFRKYGLHSNIARMICIGDIPADVRKSYDDVCQIQAEIIGFSREGLLFADLFAKQEELYRKLGYEDEWLMHGHGAPVGYMLSDGGVLYSQDRVMKTGQAYEWFVTVSGAKSAELVMNVEGKQKILSLAGKWPVKKYVTESGKTVGLPDILVI